MDQQKNNSFEFYGYKHWTLETVPRCFYVGKGRQTRAFSYDRNHKWHAIVKRYGLRVEVCIGPVTNAEACSWEIAQIALMKSRPKLCDPNDIGCNFTDGGEGTPGSRWKLKHKKSFSDNHRAALSRSALRRTPRKFSLQAKINLRLAALKREKPNHATRAKLSNLSSGERNRSSKLKWNDVEQIRLLHDHSVTLTSLALQFNVSRTQIRNIVTGKSWQCPTNDAQFSEHVRPEDLGSANARPDTTPDDIQPEAVKDRTGTPT